MILLAIFVVIYTVVAYFWNKDSYDVIGGWIAGGIVFAFLFFLTTYAISPSHDTQQTQGLHAIGAGKELSGSFFLASGSLKDKPVFYFYKEANGGYQLDSVRADRVTLVEDDSEPRIVKNCHKTYRNAWNPVWTQTECDWDLTIHVPRGSVTNIKDARPAQLGGIMSDRNFATRKVDTVILEMDITLAEQLVQVLGAVKDDTRHGKSAVFANDNLAALRQSMIDDAAVRHPSALYKVESHENVTLLRDTTPHELSTIRDARLAAQR